MTTSADTGAVRDVSQVETKNDIPLDGRAHSERDASQRKTKDDRGANREQEQVRSLFEKLIGCDLRTFPLAGARLDAPGEQGVYVLYDDQGKVVHVGRTPRAAGGIAQRLQDHIRGQSAFTRNYLDGDGNRLRGCFKFRSLVVPEGRLRALLEYFAIGQLCPAHLGIG
jgi:hypothetical protein